MDDADVGMVERRCRARFAEKTFLLTLAGIQVRGQKLQRNRAVKALIARPIHHSHPSRPRDGEDPVIAGNEIAFREACFQHGHRPTSTRLLSAVAEMHNKDDRESDAESATYAVI